MPASDPDPTEPRTPRDRGWWSDFGDALLTGEFDDEVDPETAAIVEAWRARLLGGAAAAIAGVRSPRLDDLAARMARLEDRLSRIERLLEPRADQRTTPTA